MALFEFDEGHLIPAQFGRSVPGGLTGDILRCVREQILEIVGRPLFPINWYDSDGDQEPRLTALDASGQVVSLEVIAELNSATMIDSLSRLADTAALGWNELAAAYPGGIEGFRLGWAEFRAAMPPSPAPGPRLILVVGAIADHVRPALDVLTSSGVEVHEIAVRTMSNGRIFLDVQAVGPRVYGHNPNLLLGNASGSMRQLGTMPHIDDTVAEQTGGDQARGESEPVVGGHAQPPVRADDSEGLTDLAPAPADIAGLPGDATGLPCDPDQTEVSDNTDASAASAPSAEDVEQALLSAPTPLQQPIAEATESEAAADLEPLAQQPELEDAEETQATTAAADEDPAAPSCPENEEPQIPQFGQNSEGLQVIASVLGTDTPIYWPSKGLTVKATLTAEGQIRAGHWTTGDPTEAAAIISGASGTDGWQAWRFGDAHGPSLAEALAEINREVQAEYETAGAPQRGRRGR